MTNVENNKKNLEELVRAVPILAATGNTDALNKVLDLIEELSKAQPAEEQPAATGKYLYARVLTLADGTKHYHPVIIPSSFGADIRNPKSYVMKAKDSILELQNDSQCSQMKRMAEYRGFKIQAVYVTNEVYAELERKLEELMVSVIEGARGGAAQIAMALQQLDDSITTEAVQDLVLRKLAEKPHVSGSAVNAAGEIVEKGEYIEEAKKTPAEETAAEETDDDSCDGCDCPCSCCDGSCNF
jgi:hypothetical protein